jgi:adhesin transport system membrane fusion protein
VVRGQGKVVPSRQVQVVQSLDGGIVKEILVHPGEHVEQGSGHLAHRSNALQLVPGREQGRTAGIEGEGRASSGWHRASHQAPEDVQAMAPQFVEMERRMWRAVPRTQHQCQYCA